MTTKRAKVSMATKTPKAGPKGPAEKSRPGKTKAPKTASKKTKAAPEGAAASSERRMADPRVKPPRRSTSELVYADDPAAWEALLRSNLEAFHTPESLVRFAVRASVIAEQLRLQLEAERAQHRREVAGLHFAKSTLRTPGKLPLVEQLLESHFGNDELLSLVRAAAADGVKRNAQRASRASNASKSELPTRPELEREKRRMTDHGTSPADANKKLAERWGVEVDTIRKRLRRPGPK